MKLASMDNHRFEKQNLVTIKDRKGSYDLLKCLDCGLVGKRYGFTPTVTIDGRINSKRIEHCIRQPEDYIGMFVEVIKCNASGPMFSHLTPGSKHEVIECPEGELNDIAGVWVKGPIKSVKMVPGEYKIIES